MASGIPISRMQRRRMRESGWVASTSPFQVLDTTKEGDSCLSFVCFFATNPGSKYGNAVFGVRVSLVPDFPRKSPSLSFFPPVYHSNVEENCGAICWDATGPGWVASQVIHHVIEFDLPFLLDNPNHDDPHNFNAAGRAKEDPELYDRECKADALVKAVRVLGADANREDLLKPLTQAEISRAMGQNEYKIVEAVDLPGSQKKARLEKRSGVSTRSRAAASGGN